MQGGQNLLSMAQLGAEDIQCMLSMAEKFQACFKGGTDTLACLRGRRIAHLFYEPSTRTRVSFEWAAKRLSASTVNVSASGSSVSKGESFLDMAQSLDAMGIDAMVVRHSESGAAQLLSDRLRAHVINAGDGQHEHPTQALADLLTLQLRFGSLKRLNVSIIGDVLHSRVARSNLIGLQTMGASVRVAGPPMWVPQALESMYGCRVCSSVEEAVWGAHAVMALRVQKERMGAGLMVPLQEYAAEYGLSPQKLDKVRGEAIVMHPGPVNRGVDVWPEIVDSPRSVVLNQVAHGVAVRMAVLCWVLGERDLWA